MRLFSKYDEKKYSVLFVIVLLLTIVLLMKLYTGQFQKGNTSPHHTGKGFRNPYPGFERRDFADFLKWVLIERRKDENHHRNDGYHFEKVINDGSLLRANHKDFTVTWIGHSTVLIQVDGVNILTDPIWSDRASPVTFAGPKRFVEPGIIFNNLPEIHVVLITHNHYDHLDNQTVKQLGDTPLYLVPLGLGKFLAKLGIDQYQEFDWWDTVSYNGIEYVCTPAQHFSGRAFFDRNKTLWCSWVIRGKSCSSYFGGDSGYFPVFREIGERYGPFDLVCLPIGAYLPQWFMGPVHLCPEEAVQAYLDLRGRVFLAIHWGTFKLADDPLDEPPKVLLEELQKQKLKKEHFWVLRRGETRIITHVEIKK